MNDSKAELKGFLESERIGEYKREKKMGSHYVMETVGMVDTHRDQEEA